MRTLAHIEKIEKIEPIEGADRIEKAHVLGWECVIKKGDFKEGDTCIYIEVDSIVPDKPEFEFMRDRKFRVKTIKLRKQVSQGLVMPLSILDNGKPIKKTSIGTDVTEHLGIVKHDPQAVREARQMRGQGRKKKMNPIVSYMSSFAWFRKIRYRCGFDRINNYPHFISKTDEQRVENSPFIFHQWYDEVMYSMEKLDGSSATYAIYDDPNLNWIGRRLAKNNFYVCSRNILLWKENNSIWWNIAKSLDIENKLKSVGKNIGIQGEIVGPGVQGNKYQLDTLKFYVFNVIDLDTRKRYNLSEKINFCKKFGFELVPILSWAFTMDERMNIKKITSNAIGISELCNIQREGIVLRAVNNDHLSVKSISKSWLLTYNE